MNEDSKGENADRKVRSVYLSKMEEAVKHAGYFIVRFDQERWKHRLYRFLGRVSDYKGDYKRAISYYKKAISYAKIDPEYLEYKYPRWLEVRGFLSASMIMSGETGRGHTLAVETFAIFDTDEDAIFLKKNDYVTWAIWKSGIPIRTINALLDRKVTFDKKEALSWLSQTENIFISPKNNQLWADFQYRKDEMRTLLAKLKEVN
jgi:tetratricopeptide (TPR) repeat protein